MTNKATSTAKKNIAYLRVSMLDQDIEKTKRIFFDLSISMNWKKYGSSKRSLPVASLGGNVGLLQ